MFNKLIFKDTKYSINLLHSSKKKEKKNYFAYNHLLDIQLKHPNEQKTTHEWERKKNQILHHYECLTTYTPSFDIGSNL